MDITYTYVLLFVVHYVIHVSVFCNGSGASENSLAFSGVGLLVGDCFLPSLPLPFYSSSGGDTSLKMLSNRFILEYGPHAFAFV